MPSQPSTQPPVGLTTFTQTIYSILATVAIIGNMIVILVFFQDKKLLKKSYNMLILSLAIADVLTSRLLITNPAFVLGDSFPYLTNPVLGEISCRVSHMEPCVSLPIGCFLGIQFCRLLRRNDGSP